VRTAHGPTSSRKLRDLRGDEVGLTAFRRIRSYLSMMYKQGQSMLAASTAALTNQLLSIAWEI